MSILSVLQEAATVFGLAVPATVFSATDRDSVELQALANEMAMRIAFDGHDWTKLKTLATLTGDGVSTSFPLPADYRRMLKKAKLWPSASPYSPLSHIPDTDDWLALTTQNLPTGVFGSWTLIGTSMNILPAVASAATVKFYYISNLVVDPALPGPNKAALTLDTDTFVLDERVLKLGIIWQWKANKGRPYAEDLSTYETALAMAVGADKGSNILTMGSSCRLRADTIAFPGVLGP